MGSKPLLAVLTFMVPIHALAQEARPAQEPVTAGQNTSAPAGQPPAAKSPLRVGISPFVPFVFLEGGEPEGFSIDLWRRIANELGRDYTFVVARGVAEKLEKLSSGDIDVAIGGITITSEREAEVDFTYSTTESGLGILVRATDQGAVGYFTHFNLSRGKWGIIIAFLLLILVAGHLVWMAERGRDAFADSYVPGVFEGMYWAIVTASTVGYGDKAPVRWPGRIVAALAIIVALPMFALFTAELTSAITVAEIQSQIRGPQDLARHRVGVVRGTSSASWSATKGLTIYQWDRADEVYTALEQGVVDAVIYDAPNLQHYAQSKGRGQVAMVGKPFLTQDLGIALQQGDHSLRERINQALLKLSESGEILHLRVRWFGREGP